MAGKNARTVTKVCDDSVAKDYDIQTGDELISINGEVIEDIFDYRYAILNSHLEIKLKRGEETVNVTIDKDESDDLGPQRLHHHLHERRGDPRERRKR